MSFFRLFLLLLLWQRYCIRCTKSQNYVFYILSTNSINHLIQKRCGIGSVLCFVWCNEEKIPSLLFSGLFIVQWYYWCPNELQHCLNNMLNVVFQQNGLAFILWFHHLQPLGLQPTDKAKCCRRSNKYNKFFSKNSHQNRV